MSKETTLYEYVQLADKPYGFDPEKPDDHNSSKHTLPNHIQPLDIDFQIKHTPAQPQTNLTQSPTTTTITSADSSALNTPGQDDYDGNYYGMTYYNKATNEIIVSNRGTYNWGDIGDWPQLGVGLDTGQTAIANHYAEEVVKYIASHPQYVGVTITFVGDSYGGLQAQQQQKHIQQLMEAAEDAASKVDKTSPYASISQIRGIATVPPGPGPIEADDKLNFLTINVAGDLVNLGGFDQAGVAEINIATTHYGPGESHYIKNTLEYFSNWGNWGRATLIG